MKNLFLLIVFLSQAVFAAPDLDYRNMGTLSPSDYLFGSHGRARDPVFDEYRTVDLNLNIGLGADCGRMNIQNTMQTALRNVLDSKYLGDIGKDIIASSP